jgi:hypothetical protein
MRALRCVCVAGLAVLWAGCVAVAAAGAGAGGGYYFTSRGVGSEVEGSVDDVATRAQHVMKAEGVDIVETRSEDSGDKRAFRGQKGDLEVRIEITRHGDHASQAEISARKNLVQWDKEYARRLMDLLVRA